MELSRNQMAIIKRSYANVKTLLNKKDKLSKQIADKQEEYNSIVAMVEAFEVPVKSLTGGYTSEEVLNGTMAKKQENTAVIDPSNTDVTPVEDNEEDKSVTTKEDTIGVVTNNKPVESSVEEDLEEGEEDPNAWKVNSEVQD